MRSLVWACLAAVAVGTGAPTPQPTPLDISFPVQKNKASKYSSCRTELFIAIDVSGSVIASDQQIEREFIAALMVEVEKNVAEAKFSTVVFGATQKWKDKDKIQPDYAIARPFTEELFSLSKIAINETTQRTQLDVLVDTAYSGTITPTVEAMEMIQEQIETTSDPTVPTRFVLLITDGVPNDGVNTCSPPEACSQYGQFTPEINRTTEWIDWIKANGTLVMTVGVNLDPAYFDLMYQWASEPRNDTLAQPEMAFEELNELIAKILKLLCPFTNETAPCLEADATYFEFKGEGFLKTEYLACNFTDVEYGEQYEGTVQYISSNQINCLFPTEFFPGEYDASYTIDGRGYSEPISFKYGTVCFGEVVLIWWPFVALAILPLAFARKKKVLPATSQKITRGVAKAAPAITEEYEEYEEVEEVVAPPPPVNKWKVAPTAYIGFGKARMSVDWAGVAPASAPHEGIRKKVVKKVIKTESAVPTAGPNDLPQAAPGPELETVTTEQTFVEEPDWINSTMDKVAGIFCCCCVSKK